MHLSQLRWLEGFAANGRWYALDGEPSGTVLDGLLLSRARRTVNVLRGDLRGALSSLVDDAPAWLDAVDGVLAGLARQLQGRAAPDALAELAPPRVQKAARALEAAHPRLRPLVRPALGAWRLRPDVLLAAVAWMASRAEPLARLIGLADPDELMRGLRLARLGADNPRGADALLALTAVDPVDPSSTAVRVSRVLAALRGRATPLPPESPRGGQRVLAWTDARLACPPAERDRALAVLAAVDIPAALEPWRAWESQHAARVERALAFVAQGIDRGPSIEHVRRVIAGVMRAQAAMPPVFRLDDLLNAPALLAEARHEPLHRALLRLLEVGSAWEGPLARACFLIHAAEVAVHAEGPREVAGLWDAVSRELSAGAPPRLLDSWKNVLEGKQQWWVEREMLEDAPRPAEVRRLVKALACLARDRAATLEHARRLGAALAGGLDVETAVALVRRLDTFDVEVTPSRVRAAIVLGGHGATGLAQALQRFGDGESGLDGVAAETLANLCAHAAATGGVWLLRGLLDHDHRRLIAIVELAEIVPPRGWPRLENDAPAPAWAGAYPPTLAAPLERLARVDPGAEGTARRRLAHDLPDPAALRREAAALRARAPLGVREARRLQNLEARISAPRLPSPARLARLAAKLEAAALKTGGARLAAALMSAAETRALAGLGLDRWPGPSLERAQWPIVAALTRLDPDQRALAGRLLRARAGAPPWDLRDDPVNRAYLDRLRARGIDPAPWLDDAPQIVAAADGRSVELSLCSDPLQVFAMGAHFNTCLSPRGSNFFSVVTNAADVNKRVVYARREGAVVGRCLLALTDAGHVLTFHPYAHDGPLGFETVVRDYAAGLARRMGSRVATAGRVALLLGREWYDDGARDLVGRYQELDKPELVAGIQEVAVSAFVGLLENALGRPIDDVTLPLVVSMPALEQRPELIAALAPYLLAQATLPDHALFAAARLALRSGDLMLADRLLVGLAVRSRFAHDAWTLGEVLARTRPSFTLARLRQTRPRGVRRWADERGARLAVAGLAFETLRRPRQAAACYRQAIAQEGWLAAELRPRLNTLERLEA
jgi:hypothetical protein